MGNVKITSTPYDDVLRTLLNDCSHLIIPVINEVFLEDYTGTEEIIFSPNEHFLNQQDGNEEERVTDSSFAIVGKNVKKYHFECQSSADNSMLVRFFEYDTQIALDEGEIRGNVLTVTLPHSAVLFLRHNKATPDKMKIRIVTPGGSVEYEIPVMKARQYTIEDIFGKNLLFLLPFYIFSHEERFQEYEKDEEQLRFLESEYEVIKNKLEELQGRGTISEYTRCTIIDMSNKVLEHIAKNYENVREGVNSVMGGKVLEYEAKTIWREGIEQGREEGMERGIEAFILDNLEEQIPEERILEKLQRRFRLKEEEARAYMEKYVLAAD